jgi:hypothetical protein
MYLFLLNILTTFMFMTRLEKCELLKLKGYKYDPETGKIYGSKGKEIIRKCNGYISLKYNLYGHHFAFYMIYGNVDFDELDHINRDKSDNSIRNLRIVTSQQNKFNKTHKGYYWHKHTQKWMSRIQVNGDNIYLGLFNIEKEARNAYLQAKEKYHII